LASFSKFLVSLPPSTTSHRRILVCPRTCKSLHRTESSCSESVIRIERRNVVYWNPNGRSSMIFCIEFGQPKFFSKTCKFSIIFYSTLQFSGGGTFGKHADPEKKNRNSWKPRANSRNLLEAFLRSRKKENLYGHCAINNARRIFDSTMPEPSKPGWT